MTVQKRAQPSYSFLKIKILKLKLLYKYVMGFSEDVQMLIEACLCRNKASEQVLSDFYFFLRYEKYLEQKSKKKKCF